MRLLAVVWFLLGVASLVTRGVVSLLVFRRVEYTLPAVAAISFLPSLQALCLAWVARGLSLRRFLAAWSEAIPTWRVRALWAVQLAVLAALVLFVRRAEPPPVDPRRLLMAVAGAFLLLAAALLLGVAGRSPAIRGRLLPGAVVAALVGFSCLLAAAAFRPALALPPAVVAAAAWSLGATALLPTLLRTARVLPRVAATPLETAAVLAAATVSVILPSLYLRPYLGVAWLDPARVCLALGAACVLTAALSTGRPESAPADHEAAPAVPLSRSQLLILWLVLAGSYLVGWLVLEQWLEPGRRPSGEALVLAVAIPVVQTLAVALWQRWETRRARASAAAPR